MTTLKVQLICDEKQHERAGAMAYQKYNCQGIEEFSLNEQEVDSMLGEKSYSGGNLPEDVLDSVDIFMTKSAHPRAYYFLDLEDAESFKKFCIIELDSETVITKIEEEDWNSSWRETYSVIEINEKLKIVPSWEKELHESSKSLYIYPGMGFGTGNHETTFLCLKKYVELSKTQMIDSVLDFGCGSGILGLAVRRFNQETQIDLYDIDHDAIINCKQNIELNEFSSEKINTWGPEDKKRIKSSYDLVFANILLDALVLEKEIIISSVADGGYLVVSGLLKGQEEELIQVYESIGLALDSKEIKNDWVCVSFRK